MRKLTDEQVATIHKHAKLPVRDIARLADCSISSVSKTLAAPPPRAKRSKPPTKSEKPSAPVVEAPLEAEGTPIERLMRAVASLESAARQAAADGDIARVIQAQKAVGDMTALIERLRPPPAVSVDDRPDMKAAAERARKRMHELLDRLLKEKPS